MDEARQPSSPSLAEEQQQLTRRRIRAAAMEAVALQGFDATVDEIARLSGVSPRTIFRHYARHDLLILATVRDMFDACGERPIDGLTPPDEDLDGWIDGLCLVVHTRNDEILGEAFWDIHAPHRKVSDTLAEVAVLRRQWRRRGVHHLAGVAWRCAGGSGDPPRDVEMAFALNFSAFTTKALTVDFDKTPAEVAAVTADILKVMLHRAVRREGGGSGTPAGPGGA
ncbi:MAG: TetR/AcrR family transcriptional regulator [Acidimicrobiales bacterium]|jgi:AcrR family transcriptional regulator